MVVYLFIVLIIIIIIVMYSIGTHNDLISMKNEISKSWAQIDVLLKQRHDELPKLVETCKGYMQYEQETLTKVMEARGQASNAREKGDTAELCFAEGNLNNSLGKLFAVAENYPDLKANDSFLHLQKRISQLEQEIADRRETYNENVNIFNVTIKQFPSYIIATYMHLLSMPLLQIPKNELKDVQIKF